MTSRPAPWFLALIALVAAAPARLAQTGGSAPPPPPTITQRGLGEVRYLIPGTLKDLARDTLGRILYCTAERDVGRIEPGGARKLLASAATTTFPNELRALAETPSGHIAVLDSVGDVRVLFGALPPAALVYDDEWMILDASDLVVDARGNYLIASATPSSGQRALNWVQYDGANWGYYLVEHQPLALAHDPLTGGLLLSETSAGGNLRLVEAGSPVRATSELDTLTHPGLNSAASDGDVAAESDGDLYWIAGGTVYKHRRAAGTTAVFASGYGQLRGAVIAPSTELPLSPSGWSLYVGEGANPTKLREFPNVGAPATLIAVDQGPLPGRGTKVNVTFGFQAYELTTDQQGRLLLGGTNFGSTHHLKRVTLTGTPSITALASSANGLAGPVEGVCLAPDHSLYTLSRTGTIQHLTLGPLTITTVFTDPAAQITAGKDLALDVDGSLYVACREASDFGKVLRVAGGAATLLTLTEETRGLAANPSGGMYVSQWRNMGFHGTVDLLHFSDNSLEPLPGFSGLNFTNDFVWGDGDICVDVTGTVYAVSEDDWSLVRYDAALDGCERIGSGYTSHPSGLAIALSTAGSGSTTGWSLYVAEFDNLWEKPSVPPPASTLVDASLGLTVGRTLAGTPHPRYGRPRVLAPSARGSGGLIGTAEGWLLAFDPRTGAVRPIAGPDDGLEGELISLDAAPDGGRILALNRAGVLFELAAGRAHALALAPELAAQAVEHALAAPQHTLRLRDPLTRADEWFALDGWVVWRTSPAR